MSAKEELINGLNEDLMDEIRIVICYLEQEDELDGLMSNELCELFTQEIEDEIYHAAFLTDAIVALGGEPTNSLPTFCRPTDFEIMLILDFKMELKGAGNYTEHAKLAEEIGEVELMRKLKEISAVRETHALAFRRILKCQQRESLKDLYQTDYLAA